MPVLMGLIRTMRPKQWTKNLLFVFPAIVFDGQLLVLTPFLRVLAAFFLLNLMSGAVYIINDLADIERDRQHPKKRSRPLASGQVPARAAVIAAVVLPTFTLGAALLLSPALTLVLFMYFVLQLLYTFRLKHVVIIDVLAITMGFVLRVVAGVVVIEVANFSPWLYVCTGLLALLLAVAKRRQEIMLLGQEKAAQTRPIFAHYNLPFLDEMLRVVTTSTLITYTLYTIETPSELISRDYAGLLTVPFVMYGLFRYLYLLYVKGETAPPDEVLLKDRALQIDIILYVLTIFLALYVIPAIQG